MDYRKSRDPSQPIGERRCRGWQVSLDFEEVHERLDGLPDAAACIGAHLFQARNQADVTLFDQQTNGGATDGFVFAGNLAEGLLYRRNRRSCDSPSAAIDQLCPENKNSAKLSAATVRPRTIIMMVD